MTLIVGNVVDVGLAGVDGTLRVWAWFRPEEVGLIAPYRREWEITGGEIEAGVDVIPGPAAVEIDCGPNAYTTVDVMVPDAESVAIQDLFEQVYSYTPGVVSEAWEARRGAEAAALEAELSAGEAAVSAGRALTSEEAAALSAATLSARVEQPGQDILYTSDGVPYLADPSQIENVPLTVDTSVGTRVMLGDVMIYGDTGWRKLPTTNGWTGDLIIRRVGSTVSVASGSTPLTMPMEGASIVPADVPAGFRATGKPNLLLINRNSGANDEMTVASVFAFNGPIVAGAGWTFSSSYSTSSAWPVSLPGTPL